MKKKIVLAGGSGFIGNGIIKYFGVTDYDFVVLTRQPQSRTYGVKEVYWDAKTLGPWTEELENAEALINLTGKSVNCRYTAANKQEIINSRTYSTGILGTAILQLKQPPKVWLNSSSATIYRHAEDRNMDELTGELGNDFSPGVVKAWEHAFNEIALPNTAKFTLRISIVLGKGDGVMPRFINLVRFGLGGKQGNGAQFFSWVHEDDLYRILQWCIAHPQEEGLYNCCVPNPITNDYLMRSLRNVMQVPFGLPAPKWLLKLGAIIIGTETELILKSRRVVPTNLLQRGFVFRHPEINSALKDLFAP